MVVQPKDFQISHILHGSQLVAFPQVAAQPNRPYTVFGKKTSQALIIVKTYGQVDVAPMAQVSQVLVLKSYLTLLVRVSAMVLAT